jgi:hypothetical protein
MPSSVTNVEIPNFIRSPLLLNIPCHNDRRSRFIPAPGARRGRVRPTDARERSRSGLPQRVTLLDPADAVGGDAAACAVSIR